MGRYSIILTAVFLLLTGCGSTQYPDHIWAPKSAPLEFGTVPEMEDLAIAMQGVFVRLRREAGQRHVRHREARPAHVDHEAAVRVTLATLCAARISICEPT